MQRYSGRRVLITGGGHGMGRATARRLAAEGAVLVLADRDVEAAERVSRELAAAQQGADAADGCERPVGTLVLGMDVTDVASVETAVAAATEALGGLDVVVHTVGGGRAHPGFDQTEDEVWSQMLDLNLLGAVRVVRACLPALRQAATKPSPSAVVLVGSVNGQAALGSAPYAAAKAGLLSLVAELAVAEAPALRVNAVVPGTVRTRVWDDQPDSLRRLERATLVGRVAEPSDVAASIAFLASEDAACLTGQGLVVDGGLLVGAHRDLSGPREDADETG